MQTVEEFLDACTVDGRIIRVPRETVDRKIFIEAKQKLEMIGGKWKGGNTWGFVYNADPTILLESARNGGNLKKEYQYFPTPAVIADFMVPLACIHEGDEVLEPSAGQGAIVDKILSFVNRYNMEIMLFAVEKMPTNLLVLEEHYGSHILIMHPQNDDFLNLGNEKKFDRIIANPPFSNNQDIDHVRKMYSLLRSGGRIVTITSRHWQLSKNKKETEFRDWLDSVNATFHDVEDGAFKQSGTSYNPLIIVIDK